MVFCFVQTYMYALQKKVGTYFVLGKMEHKVIIKRRG